MNNHAIPSGTLSPIEEKPRRSGPVAQASPSGGMGSVFVLWLAFGALVLFWPDTLTASWYRYLDWNLIGQVIVGVLLLPRVVATCGFGSRIGPPSHARSRLASS